MELEISEHWKWLQLLLLLNKCAALPPIKLVIWTLETVEEARTPMWKRGH